MHNKHKTDTSCTCNTSITRNRNLKHNFESTHVSQPKLMNIICLTSTGKSTVLRSLCAISLLANCGLMVPARSACIPFTDAFMLRNFSGDAPLEGKSAFAVEMDDMA